MKAEGGTAKGRSRIARSVFGRASCLPLAFRVLPLVLLLSSFRLLAGWSPQLTAISPTGGQRGTEMMLRFQGSRLEEAEEIMVYGPGFEC